MMIRAELISSHDEVWKQLARPGARLSGAERVAIAAEVRQARSCAFCKARKAALSPNAVRGWHDQADRDMPGARVELVHKLTTDPGRVTRSWVDGLIADGMEEVEYIEVAGLLSAVIVVDTFRAALGLPLRELPLPVDGVPHGQTPETAVKEDSYVPMIPVNGLAADYIDLYDDRYFVPNVQRAFSLVPEATRLAATLMASHYVPYEMVARYTDADHSYGVNKMQMELIAARVSMYNDCFY
ncbi:hypothetical protein N8993_08220 [Pseudomonadales bacterium]|jgi:hypothetical protein|nr:hypothetical protein [Pseudomonadales bacterium]MDC3359136.1 hypothetical protein [Pseudomonadales bacterium]